MKKLFNKTLKMSEKFEVKCEDLGFWLLTSRASQCVERIGFCRRMSSRSLCECNGSAFGAPCEIKT